ncbi:fungal-specific transcription factor domain-containing protein [Fusarium solani]|uniref:Fungal-specific transcription factor domain-containing protein n=1 Tax=Fusarium solani TaxID=169388 RepID=A0A9P9RAU2_FUSSL|nr:fungal-specific transcription factor domain-containing protein [Fusarium solani]KAH7271718.1 fungal-specific transcription factor domain-containing protein [Fusarium solani]
MRSRIPMHPLHQDQGAMHFPFRSKAKDKTPTRSNIQHLVSPSGRLLLTELTTSTFDSENKIDRIVNRIEELNQTIQQLSLNQSGPKYHGTALNPQTSQTAFRPTPAASEPTPSNPSSFVDESPPYSSKPEYEGESSLFAHAVFATKFLQNSVRNNSSSEVALEMTSVLNALRGVIDAQKQESDTVENLYPNALPLPPGTSLRKLPMPSTEKAMACLRIAQGRFALENKSQATDTSKDSTPIQILWLMDLQTIPEFTTHFIKVCSPGPVTEADLIIFYLGLYWLFCECTNVVEDESLKKEYTAQSIICRDSLETVLSRLPFHMPATLEHVLALCMASLYCVQRCKPSAAWNFICAASNLSQSLGLHSSVMLDQETTESKNQKTRLFWCIYTTEKMLALRIGRSSTIRENDITVPSMTPEVLNNPFFSHSFFSQAFPIWIGMSTLQGRVYDEIYSPASLAQPASVRTARARALADETKRLMAVEDDLQIKCEDQVSRKLGTVLSQLCFRSERVTSLSMLTLIYRSIPPDKPGGSVFCDECIATARQAVKEHEKCVEIFTSTEKQSNYFLLYINWTLLQSPFIPFIVLFCHMIETSDPSDLPCLRDLVHTLETVTEPSQYSLCQKQLSMFKALYDVAVKYFNIRAAATPEAMLDTRGTGSAGYCTPNPKLPSPVPQMGASNQNVANLSGMLPFSSSGQPVDAAQGQMPMYDSRTNQFEPGEFDMGIDQPSRELATWFYANHDMMRMLEDT